MPDFSLRNLTDSPVPVSYLDGDGGQQNLLIGPKATETFFASALLPETYALIRKKIIKDIGTVVPVVFSPNVPNVSWGLSFVGYWGAGTRYVPGNIVFYGGSYFLVKNEVTATSTPVVDTLNYGKFAISSPESFFGIDSNSVALGSGIFSDGAGGWISSKVTDSQVDSISIAKITNLTSTLDEKLALAGGTMTGFVLLHANPTLGAHAANKTYVDLHLPKAGGTMTGFVTLHAAPTDANHAANKQYVDDVADGFLSVDGSVPMTGTLTLSGDPTDANHATRKAYVDQRLLRSGGTMTGFITLHAAPTDANHAANKGYVDLHLPKAGGTMTGFVTLHAAPTDANHAANKQYVDTGLGTKLGLAGGTLTGHVSFGSAPTDAAHLTNKSYVDTQVTTQFGEALAKAGGTMTGFITLHAAPTDANHAANKQYVDDVFSGAVGDSFLPLTGGEMTGPIGGSHGLLPLAGGSMTGEIILAELPPLDGLDPRAGLFRDNSNGRIMHDGKYVVTEGTSTTVSDDYTVATGIGEVLVNNFETVVIDLPPAGSDLSNVRIEKISPNGTAPAIIRFAGNSGSYSELVLVDFRQSVTLSPTASGWKVVGAFVPTVNDYAVAWSTPTAETAESITVSGKVYNQQTLTLRATAFSNEGGNLGITIPSDFLTLFQTGETVKVSGTSGVYDGNYIISSKTATKLVVPGTYTTAATGHITATVYTVVTSSVQLMVKFSFSREDPFVAPTEGVTFTLSAGTEINRSADGLMIIRTEADGDFAITAVDTLEQDTRGFLHHLSAGGLNGNMFGERITDITSAGKYQLSITSIAQDTATAVVSAVEPVLAVESSSLDDATGDGGGIWADVTSPENWRVGMTAIVQDSTNHDGEYDVLEVDDVNDRVRLDTPWAGSGAEACEIYTNWGIGTFDSNEDNDDSLSQWLLETSPIFDLETGDTIIVTSSLFIDPGTAFTVEESDPTGSRVRIALPYEDPDYGEFIYNTGAIVMTVDDTDGFLVNDPVELSGSLYYNGPTRVVAVSETPTPKLTVKAVYQGDDAFNIANESCVVTTSASPTDFVVGDSVTVNGSTSSDGTYAVREVDLLTNKVSITARFTVTSTGVLKSNEAVDLTVVNAKSFMVNSSVAITGMPAVPSSPYVAKIQTVAGNIIRVRCPFDELEATTGQLTHACSKALEWLSSI